MFPAVRLITPSSSTNAIFFSGYFRAPVIPQSHVRNFVLGNSVRLSSKRIACCSSSPNIFLHRVLQIKLQSFDLHQSKCRPFTSMPKRRNKKNSNHPKKVQKFAHEEQFESVEYYFENGLRKIKPYIYKFECHAKGRWFGSKLLDVFKKEFRLESAEYYETAIEGGLIKVNKGRASPDRILKNNDYMQSKVHRHEPPVTGDPIQILAQTEDYLVINKPASIPVHPCGKYRHNTIVFILGSEYGFKGLHTIHRLDRLTSGLLLFARTLEVSKRLDAYVRERQLEKVYVCKVQGEFPSEPMECKEPIFIVSHKIGVCRVKADGKPCLTRFERLSYDGETSIVKCFPLTGRMHQIRVHLQYLGYPILNDPLYNNAVWGQGKAKGGNQDLSDEQLLTDLIEQHDMEIDASLKKARLQLLMNKKDNPSFTQSVYSAIGLQNQDDKPSPGEALSLDKSPEKRDVEVISKSNTGAITNVATATSDVSNTKCNVRTSLVDCPGDTGLENNRMTASSNPGGGGIGDNATDQAATSSASCGDAFGSSVDRTSAVVMGDCKENNRNGALKLPANGDGSTEGQSSVNCVTVEEKQQNPDTPLVGQEQREGDATSNEKGRGTERAADASQVTAGGGERSNNVDDEEERQEDERTNRLAASLCRECEAPMPDPEPHEMCIYLHALTYKGPDFEFSTPMPAWAMEHFKKTGIEYS